MITTDDAVDKNVFARSLRRPSVLLHKNIFVNRIKYGVHSEQGVQLMITPASRTENIVYAIRNIVGYAKELEKTGLKVTYLNIGDPIVYDFDTPPHIIEAATKWMRDGQNQYAHSYGIDRVRTAIAQDEKNKGKSNIGVDDILVTTGASEAIEIALTALLNPSNNILLPLPGYPLYEAVIAKIGANKKGYRLDPNNNWQPDIEHIASLIDKNTKALVLINPNNPTGVLFNKQTIQAVIELCYKHGLLLFSDEIYDKLIFDNNKLVYPSTLTTDVPIISFNGLSKNYLAPGWRIGWMICQNMRSETAYQQAIRRIAEARLCSPTPLQGAVIAALEGDQTHLTTTIKKLERRRDITWQRLNKIRGIECIKPESAFYAMARATNVTDDEVFIKELLRNTGVLFVHGSGFGLNRNQGFFRVVFLPDENTLHSAFDRVEKFLG